jgi:hypothetical protein
VELCGPCECFFDNFDFQTALMVRGDVLPIAPATSVGDMRAWRHTPERRWLDDRCEQCTREIVLSLRDVDVHDFTGNDGGHEDNSTVIESRQTLATGNQFFHRDPVCALRHFFIVEKE